MRFRRTALVAFASLGAAPLALLVACAPLAACNGSSSSDTAPPVDAGVADLAEAPPPDLSPGPRSDLGADAAAAERQACTFKRGALPGQTVAEDALVGPEIPIDTIVVLMMENRSFDHLLGNLAAYGQPDADVAPADVENPAPDGSMVKRAHLSSLCFEDTSHSWDSAHLEYDDGKLDGFARANATAADPTGARALGYYTEDDLPYLYALASTFAIGDRFFCDLLGPTQPNRDYLYAATSYGRVSNVVFSDERDNIMEDLESHDVSWKVYWETVPALGVFLDSFTRYFQDHADRLPAFYTDAAAGTLPHVVFIDPDLEEKQQGVGDDLHPPSDVQVGQQFIAKVLAALMQSPQWPHMAVFITFDENGGQYDHVAPPGACPPDDLPPDLDPGDAPGAFDRYGFRVPFFVVSPYSRPHYVSHTVYSNASITRFIETRFVLPAMSARDANSNVPLDLFDFSKPAFATPPTLPAATVDQARADACAKAFPPDPNSGF